MQNTFYYPLPYGFLRLSGLDRSTFLQRQVTNDLRLLAASATNSAQPSILPIVPAALTTPTGKIIDLLVSLDRGEAIDTLSMAGRSVETLRYFKSRIFFMDKVTVEPLNNFDLFLSLWGDAVQASLLKLGLPSLPSAGNFAEFILEGQPALLIHPPAGILPGVLLCASQTALPVIEASGVSPASREEFETARIEMGLPGIPELHGEYTPFELGLDMLVSSTKGCYTGQEVLARQVTYDKITKKLCRVQTEAPVPAGAKVVVGSSPAGEVTSSVDTLALAVLRRPHFEPGIQVTLRWETGECAGHVL